MPRRQQSQNNILVKGTKFTVKVAYTSGPIFDKNYEAVPIFSVQIINYQIDQKHK